MSDIPILAVPCPSDWAGIEIGGGIVYPLWLG